MLKLALKNIKEKKFRTLLASLSIAIATMSLFIFLGLKNGVENASFQEIENTNPLTQITVRPKTENQNLLSFISGSDQNQINADTINQIEKINGIVDIYPEIQFNNFASVEIDLLGMSLITDSMVFGVPKNFIKDDIEQKNTEWDLIKEPYPVILPSKLIDLYNFAIASPQNLPTIEKKQLIGKKLTLYPNYSTFFPAISNKDEAINLEIAGFSNKVNLIGITTSTEIVDHLNRKYAEIKEPNYLELFVETQSSEKTAEIAQNIEDLGFETIYYQKNLKEVEGKLKYLSISLGVISLIILLIAAIAIINTFLATITERTKEIGLFRALGASKSHIKQLILLEAGIIGITGSVFGIILGYLSTLIINKFQLQQLTVGTFSAETLFQIDIKLIFLILFFGTLLSTLAAYIPAHKAANFDPIRALKK